MLKPEKIAELQRREVSLRGDEKVPELDELLEANPNFKFSFVKEFEVPAIEAVEASEGVEAVEAKLAVSFKVGDILELTDLQASKYGDAIERFVEHFDYHLEIELNDVVHKADTNDLHQALKDFANSPEFPALIKTGAVFRYSKGDVHREKVMFNANEARREFYNKTSLELLAKTFTKELG